MNDTREVENQTEPSAVLVSGLGQVAARLRNSLRGTRLRARVMRGGIWLGGLAAGDQLGRLVRNMVLARLLVPEAFGLMALVMAASSAFEALTEVGICPCVIQNEKGASRGFQNAAWWFSFVRGTGLYAASLAVAPALCAFYKRPELQPVLQVAFLTMVLRGIVSPGMHVLEKEMRFARWGIITYAPGLAGVAVAIAVAFWSPNVWALVAGLVSEAAGRTVLSFVLAPFLPRWSLDRDALKDILGFARGMMGLPMLTMLFLQVPVFVVGKLCSLSELGLYTLAAGLAQVPSMAFNQAVFPTLLPAFSELKGDPERLRRSILAAVRAAAVFGIPLTAFLVVFAEPILVVAYGQAYGGAAAVLALLSIVTALTMLNQCLVSVLFALGQPRLYRRYSSLRLVALVVLIIPAVRILGLVGVPMAVLLAYASAFTLQLADLRKLVSVPGTMVLRAVAMGAKLGMIAGAICLAVRLLSRDAVILGLALGASASMISLGVGVARALAARADL